MNGAEIKALREAAQMTQTEAAVAIGVEVDTYRSWESGKRNPRKGRDAEIRSALSGAKPVNSPVDDVRRRVARLERAILVLLAQADATPDVEELLLSIRAELAAQPVAR